MYLIQILLPLSDNDGQPYDEQLMQGLQHRLTERFGGVTAYSRAPAEGWWSAGGMRTKDDIIVVEVMARDFDRAWWRALKQELEDSLRQEEIVIRAQALELL
ncbi:hypothetical protein FHS83_003139 [Rhizomicrobium palustre]|uniref:DUF3240 domain-containing protein n=1 Tax=Rhizomicrobium palustre TaxID=189966 RepID=A0A846N3J2_9PROT|nr:hypothetical protein [Rhizomicrobium palustre]NIK89821.1 hypothetical protein [Rhizomicrobium palustre]